MDLTAELDHAIRDGLRDGIKRKLGEGYNSPLDKLLDEVLKARHDELTKLLEGAISSCIEDAAFREEIRSSVREKLAKVLVQRFGGELEKQVNALKSDPMTRARITLAIEEIVKQKAA